MTLFSAWASSEAVPDPVALLERRSPENWILTGQSLPPASGSNAHPKAPTAAQQVAAWSRELRHWLVQEQRANLEANLEANLGEAAGDRPPRLLLISAQPLFVIAAFAAAVSAGYELFLGNPQWSEGELTAVILQTAPALLLGPNQLPDLGPSGVEIPQNLPNYPQVFHSFPQVFHSFPQAWGNLSRSSKASLWKNSSEIIEPKSVKTVENVSLFIPTGGSSGQLRFARHSFQTLVASVKGVLASDWVLSDTINSFCMLPLYHVSGLMQFVRSLVSGGWLAIAAPRQSPSAFLQACPQFQPETFWISLVPTQLQRLLQDERPPAAENRALLQRFRLILLGGAPAWPSLLDWAQQLRLPLAPTYGMTETASQVVTLSPSGFLAGKRGCGRVLPHAEVEILGEAGPLAVGEVGRVRVRSRSLAAGYFSLSPVLSTTAAQSPTAAQSGPPSYEPFPQDDRGPYLLTDDLGFFDLNGYLHLVGRSSTKIISGGENIFPAEVEAAIRATGHVADVAVCGVPDPDWGERVVAIAVAPDAQADTSAIQQHLTQALTQALMQRLSPAKRPKAWVWVMALPRNAQGKLDRKQLSRLASRHASADSKPERG